MVWIPIAERLPEEGEFCYVWDGYHVTYGFWTPSWFEKDKNVKPYNGITHWQPIVSPMPPGAEDVQDELLAACNAVFKADDDRRAPGRDDAHTFRQKEAMFWSRLDALRAIVAKVEAKP